MIANELDQELQTTAIRRFLNRIDTIDQNAACGTRLAQGLRSLF
jgi:hypothetical protein